MNERIAVYVGSFDPVTVGHIHLIQKASRMYDKVIVGVLDNVKKNPMFSYSKRIEFLNASIKHLPNVETKYFNGLAVNFARQNKAKFIVRGMRSVMDFESELQTCMANKMLAPEIDTVFFVADAQYQYVSSSMVREIASFGGAIKGLVPDEILGDVIHGFNQ